MDFVGRIAYYEGGCVEILDYNEERKVSNVRRLSLPNEPEFDDTSLVKFFSLKFDSSVSFAKRFPSVIPQRGSYAPISELSEGSHLDFTESVRPAEDTDYEHFSIESSCKFSGVRYFGIEHGTRHLTHMPAPVKIWVNVKDIVEIEDLNLHNSVPFGVNCFAGKNIFFRRCTFTSQEIGVRVEHGKREGRTNGALKVTFEKCIFLDCEENGLMVGAGGNALLLDCEFMRCQIGLLVKQGGNAIVKHCTFSDCSVGAFIKDRNSTADFLNCEYSGTLKDGVTVTNGGRLVFNGCRVSGCRVTGILFVGPKRSIGAVSNCVVTKCNTGLAVRAGKNDVTLTTCEFTENGIGVSIWFDVIGYVEIHDLHMCYWSGPLCAVTRESIALPAKPMTSIKHMIFSELDGNKDLSKLRLCKNAGVAEIHCFYCHITEPEDVMYKKCGRCQQVCYCSRECQKADWKIHRRKCTLT